ncbi:sulfatase [Prolixibacteraceae bacterium]|nr:sulfatase [Prolixibacteraceae bacterium]
MMIKRAITTILMMCLYANIVLAKKSRPNVVLILIDDLGWSDLGCYNSRLYETPAIDKLSSQGVRFTDSYAAHPMCIGSRFSLQTGKFSAGNRRTKEYGTMHVNELTIGEAMKQEGYTTFFAGKWHLGTDLSTPELQGYDVTAGLNHEGYPGGYFFPYKNPEKPKADVQPFGNDKDGDYLTDRLTDKTVEFITSHKDQPFFVLLSHYAVHAPLQSKKVLEEKYKKKIQKQGLEVGKTTKLFDADQKMNQDNASFAGMLESVDQSVERIEKVLKDLHLDENTIVIFTSDNGGDGCKLNNRAKSTSNLPLKAGKCWLYEGGVRIPLIVKWPKVIKPNTTDRVVCNVDLYPTILDMVKGKEHKEQYVDGESFFATLRGKNTKRKKPIFWHFSKEKRLKTIVGMPKATAIRDGKYKLIDWYAIGDYELYNLEDDISESHDLKHKEPEVAERLLKETRAWRKRVKAVE